MAEQFHFKRVGDVDHRRHLATLLRSRTTVTVPAGDRITGVLASARQLLNSLQTVFSERLHEFWRVFRFESLPDAT